MPDLIDIATAREKVLSECAPLGSETVRLEDALGRTLAADVVSDTDLPPFDSSAMDGFAVIAGPAAELPVVDESRAGTPAATRLEPGQAIRISTGAAVPAGADAVVPIERVEMAGDDAGGADAGPWPAHPQPAGGTIRVPDTSPGANIRRAGEDVRAGELVIRAGAVLGPAELAVIASLGHPEVECGRRPRVAVLATGDELVPPGEPLGPGQIRDSNAVALVALAQRAGADVVMRRRVRDEREETIAALKAALEAADVVCISGGVSVGPHDHVKPALAELGVEERFWGVRLKPGKPTWFGRGADRLVFGLPGNPVSAIVTFHLFARPALRKLAGAGPDELLATAILDVALPRSPKRDEVIRCRLSARDDGWHVEPTKEQGSHVLSSMLDAGAFALVPAGEGEIAAGERIDIEILR